MRTIGVYGKNAAGERVRMGWVSRFVCADGLFRGCASSPRGYGYMALGHETRASAIAEVRQLWRKTRPEELPKTETGSRTPTS